MNGLQVIKDLVDLRTSNGFDVTNELKDKSNVSPPKDIRSENSLEENRDIYDQQVQALDQGWRGSLTLCAARYGANWRREGLRYP